MVDQLDTADGSPIFWIHSTEMDFVTAVEADYLLPIAFQNRAALNKWIDGDGLLKDRLGRRDDAGDVVIVHGLIKPWPLTKNDIGKGLYYRQIWARAGYDYYRNATKFALKRSEGGYKTVHLYDADHAVSRTRLVNLWPEAWVNIVLVERGINRSVGAMLEKDPLNAPPGANCIEMNAESILKIFYDRGDEKMERSRVREYLWHARDRFIKFNPELGKDLKSSNYDLLYNFAMSENAWGFFDELAQALDIEPLERPSASLLIFD